MCHESTWKWLFPGHVFLGYGTLGRHVTISAAAAERKRDCGMTVVEITSDTVSVLIGV